jgi:hypothetical protein
MAIASKAPWFSPGTGLVGIRAFSRLPLHRHIIPRNTLTRPVPAAQALEVPARTCASLFENSGVLALHDEEAADEAQCSSQEKHGGVGECFEGGHSAHKPITQPCVTRYIVLSPSCSSALFIASFGTICFSEACVSRHPLVVLGIFIR